MLFYPRGFLVVRLRAAVSFGLKADDNDSTHLQMAAKYTLPMRNDRDFKKRAGQDMDRAVDVTGVVDKST